MLRLELNRVQGLVNLFLVKTLADGINQARLCFKMGYFLAPKLMFLYLFTVSIDKAQKTINIGNLVAISCYLGVEVDVLLS